MIHLIVPLCWTRLVRMAAVPEEEEHGVVPLVFPAGVFEILPQSGAFSLETTGQLVDRTLNISNAPGLWKFFSHTPRTSAERFGREGFRRRASNLPRLVGPQP